MKKLIRTQIKFLVEKIYNEIKDRVEEKALYKVELFKKIINETITNFYKPPPKFNRSDSEEEAFQRSKAKAKKEKTKEDEAPVKEVIDLENQQFNDKAEEVSYAREKIMKRIVEKSPDDGS